VFARLVEYWRSTGKKRETTLANEAAAFGRTLATLIGGKPLISLTARDALHVLQLDQGYALPRNTMILRGIVRDASKVGAVAPDLDVQVPRKVDNGRLVFLEPWEISVIHAALPASQKPAWLFAIATGVRVGELVGAQWSDVDLVNRSFTVRHALVRGGNRQYWHPPKNGKPRTVPLSDLAIQALEAQAALFPPVANPASLDEGRIFHQSVVGFQEAIRRALPASGVTKNASPHTCRHTFASLQVQNGVPLERVSQLLGHSSLSMTMKYAHLRPSQLQESVDQLSALVTAAL
jgi:integrase